MYVKYITQEQTSLVCFSFSYNISPSPAKYFLPFMLSFVTYGLIVFFFFVFFFVRVFFCHLRYSEGSHSMHTPGSPRAAVLRYVFVLGHLAQPVMPPVLKYPGGQSKQLLCLGWVLYVPAGHGIQNSTCEKEFDTVLGLRKRLSSFNMLHN